MQEIPMELDGYGCVLVIADARPSDEDMADADAGCWVSGCAAIAWRDDDGMWVLATPDDRQVPSGPDVTLPRTYTASQLVAAATACYLTAVVRAVWDRAARAAL